ncbi:hypothetical protein [Luteolibacter luteus]|jgi:hypothetical protein|uniref:Uncharacterized protein n=1 Tax=Luteolibacter luteus TaxID=2728835 RepID=A0A858RF12_9BACT|nr:hypothetical protein [Luteolibacter luteus]QJE95686.1 hypothetical protein HHL09_07770 [Luteolibacter luteus]
MSISQRLSNHFSACRLISLAKLKAASEILNKDSNGPYLIMQHGYEPGDASMRAGDYLLGRSGAWLGTHWFIRMPVQDRRKEFLFGTVAEVMELMETLTSKVSVISTKPDNVREDGPVDEELQKAIEGK